MIRPRRNWTSEEDKILRREVEKAQAEGGPVNWHETAAFLPGRTNKDCRKRWYGTMAAKFNKGPWTEVEDERLRLGYERHGSKWAMVASVVETRLPDQCSKRWSHAINPDIDHSLWTPQEDDLLIQGVQKHGHYWQQIVSLYFPRRTSLSAKNRFHILRRRMKNKIEIKTDDADKIGDLGHPSNILPRPEQNRPLSGDEWDNVNSDLGICPALGTPDFVPLLTHDGESSVSGQGSTKALKLVLHSPLTEPSSDDELMSFSFSRSVTYGSDHSYLPAPLVGFDALPDTEMGSYPETSPAFPQLDLDCAFPPAVNWDDIGLGSAVPPSTPAITSASLPDTNSNTPSNSRLTQRMVTIQAVCSTDNLIAMFQAVTDLSISAVFRTDV